LKLAITGQDGFIGYHLYNTLKYKYSSYEVLDFKKTLFKDEEALDSLVSNLDIIVHLAGVNRSARESDILDKNLFLTQQLVDSIKRTNFDGKLIFASSIKCNEGNAYGKSKRNII
jgi:UDP-2-acetamido-2,6-beta-L-arabino-hexul-4-ose reductase